MGLVKLIYVTLFGLLSTLQMFALCYSLISRPPYMNAIPFPTNSLTEAKLDLVIASVVSTGCWYGQKNLLKQSARKLVLMMENFIVEKPSKTECKEVGVDDGKFYCGWKGKFSLNLQAVCNA